MASALSLAPTRVFGVRRSHVATRRPLRLQAYKITFKCENGEVKVVEAKEGEYLLDIADANNIDIPASCRGGECGSCVGKLVNGKVDMGWACELDDGKALTEGQLADGFILPCSAVAVSDCTVEYCHEWGLKILKEWNNVEQVDAQPAGSPL